jgi:hypothetical protein
LTEEIWFIRELLSLDIGQGFCHSRGLTEQRGNWPVRARQ